MAIYAKKADKTFFVYGSEKQGKRTLLTMISYYDHKRHLVPRPTIVHDWQTANKTSTIRTTTPASASTATGISESSSAVAVLTDPDSSIEARSHTASNGLSWSASGK